MSKSNILIIAASWFMAGICAVVSIDFVAQTWAARTHTTPTPTLTSTPAPTATVTPIVPPVVITVVVTATPDPTPTLIPRHPLYQRIWKLDDCTQLHYFPNNDTAIIGGDCLRGPGTQVDMSPAAWHRLQKVSRGEVEPDHIQIVVEE